MTVISFEEAARRLRGTDPAIAQPSVATAGAVGDWGDVLRRMQKLAASPPDSATPCDHAFPDYIDALKRMNIALHLDT